MVLAASALGTCEMVARTKTLAKDSPEQAHLRDLILDLMKRSSACILDKQVAEVEQLLIQFANVFSKDHDHGRTNLVKHDVHTSGS